MTINHRVVTSLRHLPQLGRYWAAGGVAPRESLSAIERVQFGCIGVGGKGASDSEKMPTAP